jgi:hypothetical protein
VGNQDLLRVARPVGDGRLGHGQRLADRVQGLDEVAAVVVDPWFQICRIEYTLSYGSRN